MSSWFFADACWETSLARKAPPSDLLSAYASFNALGKWLIKVAFLPPGFYKAIIFLEGFRSLIIDALDILVSSVCLINTSPNCISCGVKHHISRCRYNGLMGCRCNGLEESVYISYQNPIIVVSFWWYDISPLRDLPATTPFPTLAILSSHPYLILKFTMYFPNIEVTSFSCTSVSLT